MFITFTLEPRQMLLGRIEGDHIALSVAGEIVWEELRREDARHPGISLRAAVVMPDHVHLLLKIAAGLPDPLHELGRFIYNVKCRSQRAAARSGVIIAWQWNYHDRICCSRDIIDLVEKYIANNPLKWALMHGNPPPLKVYEPLEMPRLPAEEWWTGVGNVSLLAPESKIAAVRLSRTIPAKDYAFVTARLLTAAEKGYVLAGTWISPCERQVFTALTARDFPIIRAVQDPLAMVYRPKGDEPGLFASKRYLLLSRVAASGCGRGEAWHGINDALAAMVPEGGGTSVYVRQVAGEQNIRWDFR